MTKAEALALRSFAHYCTCGGYAWSMHCRDVRRPHLEWCPQRAEHAAWVDALGEDFDEQTGRVRDRTNSQDATQQQPQIESTRRS